MGLNIYGMYTQNGNQAGFWVRRDSWAMSTFAQVRKIAGSEHGPLTGKPPYYERQKVTMDFYMNGRIHEMATELSCPGTYAYTLINDPRRPSTAGPLTESPGEKPEQSC